MDGRSAAYMLWMWTVLAIGRTMPHSTERAEGRFIEVIHMACAPRQVSPTWCELLFYFALLHNKTEHPHLCSRGQQVPSHPGPHLIFPLCWAQCSFLATQFLILALLAYLNLAETKHGFIWWFASEERWWWHFVVNCLHMWGRLDMFYLGRAGKNKDRVYVFAESWECSVCWRDTEREDDGCGGFFPACWYHTVFPFVFLQGDSLFAGTDECFLCAFNRA